VAEMAMAGGRGATLDTPSAGVPPHSWLFGEDQARYLIETSAILAVEALALEAGVRIERIGTVGGAALTVSGHGAISVAELMAANEAWLPGYMQS
jgi:phosphoribosylformylglycinamidine synthase subunit PurL